MLAYGIVLLFRYTGKDFTLLLVKLIRTDLSSLSFIFHLLVHSLTVLMADCSFLVDSEVFSPVANMAVSSAKVAMVTFLELGMSLVNMRYRIGPRTLPYGTPALISLSSENSLSNLTLNILPVK